MEVRERDIRVRRKILEVRVRDWRSQKEIGGQRKRLEVKKEIGGRRKRFE